VRRQRSTFSTEFTTLPAASDGDADDMTVAADAGALQSAQ